MKKTFLALAAALLPAIALQATTRYAGGDISLLPEYENAKSQYKTHDGKPINDVLTFFHDEGMNAMRVRLFVNPALYDGPEKDANACQDLEYIIPLCRDIVDHGFKLMLDFHYSDTWADPAKQWTPEEWKDLDDNALYVKINEYTKEVLTRLKEEGITPAFIQTGNEISYGMLWGPWDAPEKDLHKVFSNSEKNWPRFITLLENAIAACREVCPEAEIIIHSERIPNTSVLTNFFDHLKDLDYDIIGLSYYPYFHGPMNVLNNALNIVSKRYTDKEIMIVEAGYPYKWEVPGTTHDLSGTYPYTDAGQDKFARELVETAEKYEAVTGIFWWWMEYNAYGTSLSGWYNAPLFDSTTGRATSALHTLASFATPDPGAVDGIFDDSLSVPFDPTTPAFDLLGRSVTNPSAPGLYIQNGRKHLIR